MKAYKLLVLFALIATLLTGCADNSQKNNDKTERTSEITINILHAGGSHDGLTLLNAQETFEHYYAQGYRYFEYDFRLSSDGRLIGTHSFEHLEITDDDILYEDFKALRLTNGFTPVNEEWLMETIKSHSDVKIVIDAKMNTTDGDIAVLARIEELEKIYDTDVSANIIPEIFSTEMWEEAQKCTTFDGYFFSHYKVYYSIDKMLEDFDSPKIIGVAIPAWSDDYIKSNIYRVKEAGKMLLVFTVTNEEEMTFAREVGADGIYVNGVADK